MTEIETDDVCVGATVGRGGGRRDATPFQMRKCEGGVVRILFDT